MTSHATPDRVAPPAPPRPPTSIGLPETNTPTLLDLIARWWKRRAIVTDPPDRAAAAVDELVVSIEKVMGTLNFYSGPGARTAVSRESIQRYERVRAALAEVKATRS